MLVSELWRYPIKSMKGEPLEETTITSLGIPGDREIVVVRSSTGRVWTSRSQPAFLGLRGQINGTGTPTVNGLRWDSPEAQRLVDEAAGEPTQLLRVPGPERFDVLPLLVATDGAAQYLKIDRRRVRSKIVVAGVGGPTVGALPGRTIPIGQGPIPPPKLPHVLSLTPYDPPTLHP